MQINRQPRWYEELFPNETTFIYRLLKQGERGRIGSYYKPEPNYQHKLPIYDEVKKSLPRIVIDNHPEWEKIFNLHRHEHSEAIAIRPGRQRVEAIHHSGEAV